jgi:hypothetical protein
MGDGTSAADAAASIFNDLQTKGSIGSGGVEYPHDTPP